jgi:hypothetical protein
MALTYSETGIADADFAVLKPIKGSQAILLRDNPKASRSYVRRNGDHAGVVSSTVLVDDGVLEFAADANQGYAVRIVLYVTCRDDAGIKLAMDVPAGSTLSMLYWGLNDSTDVVEHGWTTTDGAGVGVVFGVTAGAITAYVTIDAIVAVAGTAGDIKLQYAQQVSIATATVIKAGSWLTYYRVQDLSA